MDLIVSRVKSFEELMGLRAEWRELEIESRNISPFVTWEWVVAWWRNLREAKFGVADTLDVRCMRTRNGKLVGAAPMMITKRPSRGVMQFRQLQFFGADPNITELRGPLALPSRQIDVYRALLCDIRACAAEWDWASLSGIPAGLSYERLLGDHFDLVRFRDDVSDYVLPLPPTWEELRSGLRRNIKESLRKCYNSLKRDGLDFELKVVRERSEMRAGLDEFFRLHLARASVTGTINHSDVFSDSEKRRFLVAACEELAERDAARVFLLHVAGQVAAVRIGFVVNDSLYLYFSGYEPGLAKYSVMTTATAEAIKYAIEQGFSTVNLSPGTDVSKTRWNPQQIVTREALVVAPNVRGQMMHYLYERGRDAIDNTPTLQVLRRIARRGPASTGAFLLNSPLLQQALEHAGM